MNIEELIMKIKKRPGMFVGELNLEPIYHFINGFRFNNIINNNTELIDIYFKDNFSLWVKDFITEKYHINCDSSRNYLYYIQLVSSEHKEQLNLFFELCDRFFLHIKKF